MLSTRIPNKGGLIECLLVPGTVVGTVHAVTYLFLL